MEQILILGAKSDIAKAYATLFASKGYSLILAGRNIAMLQSFKATIAKQYQVTVVLEEFDALNLDAHEAFMATIAEKIYGVICCVGYLGNQNLAEHSLQEAQLIWNTNFLGCANILAVGASILRQKNKGFIIGVSSVAGNRGRKSNYFYGSAKAGFSAFLSGLRGQLLAHKVHVITVKPGFVATKMTAHLSLPKLLTTTPEVVANTTFKALQKKKNVIYVTWIWRYIMWGIQLLPEAIFKKTNL